MIISHKHKFIFIKTAKVGGTSVEIALSSIIGEEDIITPNSPEDEVLRTEYGYLGPRNYKKSVKEMAPLDWLLVIKRMVLGPRTAIWPHKFRHHSRADEVQRLIGSATWDSYFKFTIERTPFDKTVSMHSYFNRARKTPTSFADYFEKGLVGLASDFDRYSNIGGTVIVDRILRYENLANELSELSREHGWPEDIGLLLRGITTKSTYRQKGSVSKLYTPQMKQEVEIAFAREIMLLGYEFPE